MQTYSNLRKQTAQQPLNNMAEVQPVESETVAPALEKGSRIDPNDCEESLKTSKHESALSDTEILTHLLHSASLPPSKSETVDTQAGGKETTVQPIGEPTFESGRMEMDNTPNPSSLNDEAPKQNPDAENDVNKIKETNHRRRYLSCVKDRRDPLKMDMSEVDVLPLTSSPFSLQCLKCHIIFSDHKTKERHLKLSHPLEYQQSILKNVLFTCYVCDRHFTNSTELMTHQKAHIEKKPYKCPICGQAFYRLSELTGHKKIHFGQDGYACSDCGKPCKTLTLLKYHRRKHTGEKPYVCKECGKRFSFSKDLSKHMESHLQNGTEEDEGNVTAASKAQLKRKKTNTGASAIKYPCSVCKATFKTTKTRLSHMKNKHNLIPDTTTDALQPKHQVKQGSPIITPITITESTLLHVEPIGPLQQVDANIDTEQIRKLIESLGNVQKVNQVVILGQVQTHTQTLGFQHFPGPGEPINLNPTLPSIELSNTEHSNFVEQNHAKDCDFMEQTIILEPITPPNGELEYPSFQELNCQKATPDHICLTVFEGDQTERNEGVITHELLHQAETVGVETVQTVYQSEVADLKQNPEQTIILELTSALLPVADLEQTESHPQQEVPSTSLLPTTELERSMDDTGTDHRDINQSCQPLMPTVQLDMTPVQTEQQDLSNYPVVPTDTFTQSSHESPTNPEGEVDSQMQKGSIEEVPSVNKSMSAEDAHEEIEKEAPDRTYRKENLEKLEQLTVESPSQEHGLPLLETKQGECSSDPAVNVMSAQELVKVRKRRPVRTFVFEDYMYQHPGSTRKSHLHIGETSAKRQRTNKSHIVIEFGPKNKDKKKQNQKQRKRPQSSQLGQEGVNGNKMFFTNMSEKKVAPKKKGRKSKKDKEVHLLVAEETSTAPCEIQEQQSKVNKKRQLKKEKDVGVEKIGEQQIVVSAVLKRKKTRKVSDNKAIAEKLNSKERRRKLTKDKEQNAKINMAPINVPIQQITQDSLLLLKGHKQPQLKVYKLDPSKAAGQRQEVGALESHKNLEDNMGENKTQSQEAREPPNGLTAVVKKKGGRPKKNQKALSLLSSLAVSHPPPEAPRKPKTTRKRKSSFRIETEGVITSSQSRRALECKDCGEKFNSVSSLQEHKATMHKVESPGLTFTNGNIFEGVSGLSLYQPPKRMDEVIGGISDATDWDTEAEMREMALGDRECSVSFPALNPSPSLPVADTVEASGSDEREGKAAVTDTTSAVDIVKEPAKHLSPTTIGIHSLGCSNYETTNADKLDGESPPCLPMTLLKRSPQSEGPGAEGCLASDQGKPTCQNSKDEGLKSPLHRDSETEMKHTADEDIKDDLFLDVDLVTVGEQNEMDQHDLAHNSDSQNGVGHGDGCNPDMSHFDINNEKTTEISPTFRSSSSSTQPLEFKKEDEDIVLEKRGDSVKGVGRKGVNKGKRGRRGSLRCGALSRKSFDGGNFRKADAELEECQVIFQKDPLTTDFELMNKQGDASTVEHSQSTSQSPQLEINHGVLPGTCMPSVPSLADSNEDPVASKVEELKSDHWLGSERVKEQNKDKDRSPTLIPDRVNTSGPMEAADTEQCHAAVMCSDSTSDNGVVFSQVMDSEEIKVEDSAADSPVVIYTSKGRPGSRLETQHQSGVRAVLVKQESSLILSDPPTSQGSVIIQWNVEQMDFENIQGTETQSGVRSGGMSKAQDFHTKQCIFYPVKEEEREVLLGSSLSDSSGFTLGGSSDATLDNQTESQLVTVGHYEDHFSTGDNQETSVRVRTPDLNDPNATEAEEDLQALLPIREFLLQSSDEDDSDVFEYCDHQPVSEAQALAYLYRNKNRKPPQLNEISDNLPDAVNYQKDMREPIHYFSKYFSWDTWDEIAQYTNKLSKMENPVTAKEVSQLVGIHIAMGTLKFPSLKLYWQDLTKVPLVADAMPLSRFLQLSHKLKLALPEKDSIDNLGKGQVDGIQNKQPPTTSGTLNNGEILNSCQWQGDNPCGRNPLNIQINPLWKVQPILHRFQAGCQLLKQEGDYGVDQYPLPLTTGKVNDNLSLHCTVLIGVSGLITKLELGLDLSDKEAVVEKMAPRDSMVFLCRQDLSTPAMLERLLEAGVYGAGKVGGAIGQMGDEFVSSDGKLILRRSHRGFVLSNVRNEEQHLTALMDNLERAQMLARLHRDLQNLYNIPHTTSAPSCWPQGVFWFLTDLALVNSWLLYRQDLRTGSEPLTLMAFRLEVSKALIFSSDLDTQGSVPPQPPTHSACGLSESPNLDRQQQRSLPDASIRYDGSGHWPEQLGEGEGGRCRFGGCERTSRVLCLKCCVFLCISRNHNCFMKFHNQEQ